jgi:dipeptidyl aminopeptidase/acylaminoacyl peptidase
MAYRQYALTPNQGSVSAAVADSDGKNGIVLARDIRNLSHIAWSPDSQYVAFSGSIAGGPESGWIARADGSVPPNVFTTVDGAWDPTWSPDGTRIAIGANSGLLVMNRDGSGVRRVNQRDFTEIGNRGEIADWSPDGTQLLFTAFTGDGNADYEQEVYVVGLDGRPERLLSPDARRAREPVWSPDGSRVAYMRAGTGLGPIVWITDPSGLAFKKLDGDYGWYQPIWSPDGTKVMVTDDRPGPENLEGPAVRVILDVDGSAPPVVIPAPGITPDDVPDWAGSWQRVATN